MRGITHLLLKVGKLLLLVRLELLNLFGGLVACVLELLSAVCRKVKVTLESGWDQETGRVRDENIQVRAFWTILAASFSASRRV